MNPITAALICGLLSVIVLILIRIFQVLVAILSEVRNGRR